MTDLTKELNRSQGIPFLEYKQFVTRTFFPKVSEPVDRLDGLFNTIPPSYVTRILFPAAGVKIHLETF